MSVWTREQYLRFSDAVADKPYSHIAFEILFWCGLRVGEMLALTPSDIDFETPQIRITKSFGRVGGMDVTNPQRHRSPIVWRRRRPSSPTRSRNA